MRSTILTIAFLAAAFVGSALACTGTWIAMGCDFEPRNDWQLYTVDCRHTQAQE